MVRRVERKPTLEKARAQVVTSLPDILQWARFFDVHRKEWLILGKGPSYRHVENTNLDDFYTCSLNHVVRQHPVDLAHVIDIDVVHDCKSVLEKNARFLVLPYYPHVNQNPTTKSIEDFAREIPVLQSLQDQNRLVWYNLSSSKGRVGSSPVIVAQFFSAEAALNVLAACGVKRIRSLGVDGGNTYASSFEDLNSKTLLASIHTSFDRQFEEIAKTIRCQGIFYAPLHTEAPIRIFVGTDTSQVLAARVLEYSIKKYASMSVKVVPMCELPVPVPKDPANRPRTGFSFARFLIPALCGYKGRAIYLDADMLVFDDISKLWAVPMGSADILCAEQPRKPGRARQYSVLVMNCSTLPWKIDEIINGLDEGRYDYRELMYEFCIMPPERIAPTIPYEWNSLEVYEPRKTRLIHYTDMPTQPWVSSSNPNGALWYACLREAVEEGFLNEELVCEEVSKGNVSPDLPSWIGLPRPSEYGRLKKTWTPPYRRLQNDGGAGHVGNPVARKFWARFRGASGA